MEWSDRSLVVASDDRRRARYRLLQSWYRQHVLEFEPGKDRRGIVRASMLPKSAPQSANFLSPEIHEYVQARVPVVRSQNGTLEEDRLYRNMLSSMPMCFNIFGALRVYPITAARMLADCTRLDVASLTRVEVEWTPDGEHPLGDRTAFDAFVEYLNSAGDRCFFGVETKYTEPFSQEEYFSDRYAEVTAAPPNGFTDGAAEVLVGRNTNQLWRNAMLAAAVRQQHEYAEGRVLVLALDADTGAEKALYGCRDQHTCPDELFASVTLGALASTAEGTVLDSWSCKFRRRYLDLTHCETAHV